MNQKQSVTWEMITAKLDEELQDTQAFASPDVDQSLLPYFRVSTAHIHRHLKRHRIPDDLYEAVYKRSKILGHIAHHWLDEAKVRGGDTRDKESVAAISVKNWLEQVRREEQETALAGLRLREQSLIYSEVELTANNKTATFLIGGIPDQYDIDGAEQYQDFIEDLPPQTEIDVRINSWSIGTGESENAMDDELSIIADNQELLEKVLGIDPLQSDSFTVFVS